MADSGTCLLRSRGLLGLGDTDGLSAGWLHGRGRLSPGLAGDSRSRVGGVKDARLGVACRRARALSCHCDGGEGLKLWVETRQ